MGVPSKDLPFPAILGQQIFPLRWILPFKAVTADFEQRGGRVASGLFVSPGEAVESHHGILGKAKEKDANIIHFETGKMTGTNMYQNNAFEIENLVLFSAKKHW